MALFGLAVCGWKSSRMGTDKSQLQYFEIPQAMHVYNLLTPFCEKVFVSCNAAQSGNLDKEKTLVDLPQYENIGPMAALLTAFQHYPDHDFLVVGCDYPFLTTKDLSAFISNIKNNSIAAAFHNNDGKYEPLLAWYAKETTPLLLQKFEHGKFSLQHFLKEIGAEKHFPESKEAMRSVDTPEEYEQVKAIINVLNKD